jgi:hypothetical protein
LFHRPGGLLDWRCWLGLTIGNIPGLLARPIKYLVRDDFK